MSQRVQRHQLVDRLLHWLMAFAVLVLLGTAFLPILGFKFSWVEPHWIAGVVLTVAVALHLLRSLLPSRFMKMWIGLQDLKSGLQILRWTFKPRSTEVLLPGKYSLAQKLYHHAIAVVVLTTIGTGVAMLYRIDSPLLERDPYRFSEQVWGWIYVAHGFAALVSITLIMLHIYFALRPEKFLYTRSMLRGWITKQEYRDNHDPTRWEVDD